MSRFLFFGIFLLFIFVMLALDLGVFHKKDHEVKMKEAGLWTAIWIVLSMVLALFIRLKGEWMLGISDNEGLLAYLKEYHLEGIIDATNSFASNLDLLRKELFSQYLAGYFLEESLSIDNIFVMIMIFVSFGIQKEYYHRVLFWGIMGAIILRFVFIFALGSIVTKFSWVLAIFGIILIWSGIKMFRKKDDENIDTENHPAVRFCSKYFRVTPKMDGHNFFTKIDGKKYITPLFIVLIVIEFSDIIFAVDSIPAVFSVTTDPFIVYFSNIFAIMGLRSLFFLLSNIKDMFWLLSYGLGALLTFIGVKMIIAEFLNIHISTGVSLCVILGILLFSILFSIIFPQKDKEVANQ